MKKVTWKQKSITKCIAWLLVFALILPMLPMEAAADTETQAETLNPELEEISFCNFKDSTGAALADGKYTGTAGWIFQGYYQGNASNAFENKVLNMDITFGGTYEEVIYIGGKGIWQGMFLKHPANADYLVFGFAGGSKAGTNMEILPGELNGKQLVEKSFNFKLSFEIVDSELKLGIWIDNELFKNTYISISNYSDYTCGYIHTYLANADGWVDIQSHRKQWNYSSPLEEITFSDLGIADGTYYMRNPAWVLLKEYYGNNGIARGFAGKVINGDVTFSAAPFHWRIGSEKWGNTKFAFYRDASTPDKAVKFGFNGTTYTLTSAVAGTNLVEDKFNLKISFQEVDTNADGTMDRLKVGLWFDNALYGNDYFTIDGDYSTQIYGLTTIHTIADSTGYVTFGSCKKVLDPTLKEFTFGDFNGGADGTYSASAAWSLMKEYFSGGTTVGAFSGKVLNGYLTFGNGPMELKFGQDQWSKTAFRFYRDNTSQDGELYFTFNGTKYTLTPAIAGTELVGKRFNLKISFQEIDTNEDGTKDRLRVGLWFNDVLYNNTYFYVDGNYSKFIHGLINIYGPNCGEGGYVTLTSYKEKEGQYITETNTGDMNRVPYNNDEITADLGVGCASYVVVVDKNKDGYMDLMVGSNAVPFGGTLVFYGNADSQNATSGKYMVMEKGRQISELGNTFNATYLYDENGNYEKTLLHGAMVIEEGATQPSTSWAISDAAEYPTVKALGHRISVSWPSEIEGDSSSGFNPLRQNLADFDGDGKLDFITGWGCWDEYSEEEVTTGANVSGDKFDSNGVWGDDNGDRIGDDDGDGDDDPLHAWIVWNKNTSESNALSGATYETESQLVYVYDYELEADGKTKVAIESSKRPLDVYGGGYPQLYDWDNDNDLDIICASFTSEITYFENIGSSTSPIYAAGRSIPLVGGGDLELDGSMPSLTSFDWNNDGFMDMICGEEDGRVSLVQHSGTFDENNTPIMYAQTFFQTPADSLKDGVLNTPYSVDWDGDGDEDIISGNSSGYISFIKNLSIEKNKPLTDPVWANPVPFTNRDGEVYRFMAEYNGSIQGPAEAKWGYTQVSVADWNGDGVLDVMSNNISGRVFIHYGIEGEIYKLEDPTPVEVEWENGNKYPTWNWWAPEGNELVTQWRTTPYMIDIPLDEDGDGVATGDGLVDLVIMDQEGYLSFFQRYRDTDGTLKLKEGQRIFKAADGTSALRFSANSEGKSGKIAYLLADYDMDGDLDIIRNNSVNMGVFRNISTTPGTYVFQEYYSTGVHSRMLSDHTPAPTICDWNQDNVPDLLIGTMDGHLYYMTNNEITSSPIASVELNAEITDSIAMNYSVTLAEGVTGVPTMTFAMAKGETLKNIQGEQVGTSNTYTFTYPDVMAQNMANTITAKVTVGTYSDEYNYSILDYCGKLLTTEEYSAYRDLVVNLVQYGEAVQEYRVSKNMENAPAETITEQLSKLAPEYATYDEQVATTLDGVADSVDSKLTGTADTYLWKNVTLVLGNKVKIRARFTATDIEGLTIKAKIGSEEQTLIPTLESEGVYRVDFDKIYANEYAESIAITFYQGDQAIGQTLNYSVNSYLSKGTTDTSLSKLLVAINNFGNAAVAYKLASASAAQ